MVPFLLNGRFGQLVLDQSQNELRGPSMKSRPSIASADFINAAQPGAASISDVVPRTAEINRIKSAAIYRPKCRHLMYTVR
jgi:hypothetical protein